jgi:hypothetical protein
MKNSVIKGYEIPQKKGIYEINVGYDFTFLNIKPSLDGILTLVYLISKETEETVEVRKISVELTDVSFEHDWSDDYLGSFGIFHVFDITDRD